MRCTAMALLAALAVGNAAAQAPQQQLKPAWTRPLPARIEWVAPAGQQDLVVGMSSGELLMLDAETGFARSTEPVRADKGVQLAEGTANGIVYAYDRFSAYALAIPDASSALPARSVLLWQAGEWPLEARSYQGDPEFLTRVAAAHATSHGLLLARSDGRLALLGRKDGRVRWQLQLPKLADARLHVRGDSAALMFKHGDRVKAAFLELNRRPLDPPIRTLGETWPIYSALLPGARLLVVWPRNAIVMTPAGRSLRFEPEEDNTFRAAGLDVYVPGEGAPADALLLASHLALDGQARLSARDLANRRIAWRAERDAPPDALLTSLRVIGERVLVTSRRAIDVYQATSGRWLSTYCGVETTQLLGATLTDNFAYGVYRGRGVSGTLDPKMSFSLARVPLQPPSEEAPNRPTAKDAATFNIELTETPQHVVWTSRLLILADAQRLRAYALP